MPGLPRGWAIRFVVYGAALALAAPPRGAGATTLDPRALLAAGAPVRAAGRVAEARAYRDSDGVLRTHVTLVDAAGRETARFTTLGGVEGRLRWVAEGVPVFRPGQDVAVALTRTPLGLAALGGDAGDPAAAAAAPTGASAPATTLDLAPVVDSIDPTLGPALPTDGQVVHVHGSGFGAQRLGSRVTFQGLFDRVDAPVISWSDTEIVCRVPAPGVWGDPQVLSGVVNVWTAAGGWSGGGPFAGGPQFNVLWQWAGDGWPVARLPLAIWVNPGNSAFGADLGAICADAAAQWNTPGSYAQFVYRGLTDAQAGNHGDRSTPPDGRYTVQWKSPFPYGSAYLAITWSLIDTLTLDRVEVDMELNGDRPWTLDPEGNPSSYDLPSTLTHEFGHWLRLGHTQRVASVMLPTQLPGDRRRQTSVNDRWGASWIHPTYGTVTAPDSVASGAAVKLALSVFDRRGEARPGVAAGAVTVRAVPLTDAVRSDVSPLDPPLTLVGGTVTAQAAAATDGNGATTASLAGLADGRWRIEVTADGQFVRPAPVVRVGAAPVAPAPALALAAPRPSPLRPGDRGVVRFTLPRAAVARLLLYDARGRIVRVLATGALAAGPHDAPLEATGADGRTLAGGVYFVRLTARDAASRAELPAKTARVVVLP